MEQHVILNNNKGFTLLEAMIAIMLLAFMMMAALTGLVASYKTTSLNALRNEGIKIAQELVTDERNTRYVDLVVGTTALPTQTRQVNNANVNFTVQRTVSDVVLGVVRSVQITVTWPYKGQNYTYTSTAIVGAT